ncbi:MAG: hypothetical protein DSY91_02960 [Deltaproteobacteria bacterium]|nr:MAG: hypothetical protein DSY91_02960 [Deltaproteobacteria bacterium]
MSSNKPSLESPQKTRVGLLFFSGAGNTECLAKIFEKVMASREDCEVVFCARITRALDPEALKPFDLLGVGFPIYFRRTPQVVFEVISQLKGEGKRAFAFCTKGMYSGNVAREVLKACAGVGFEPVGNLEIHAPGTDLLLSTKKGSLSEKIVKRMRSRKIGKKVRDFIEAILDTRNPSIPGTKWYTFLDEKGIKPLERLFTKDYQIFRGKYRVIQERCTGCLLCVRDCPEGNIRYQDGLIVFGDNCDTCLRCIHHCPTEAIQLGNKTLKAPRYRPTVSDDLEIITGG